MTPEEIIKQQAKRLHEAGYTAKALYDVHNKLTKLEDEGAWEISDEVMKLADELGEIELRESTPALKDAQKAVDTATKALKSKLDTLSATADVVDKVAKIVYIIVDAIPG